MGKTEIRKEKILELIGNSGKLSANDAAEAFSVSLPTVRRLFRSLAEEGLVLRTHGGIRHIPEIKGHYSFNDKAREFNEEKARIAEYASKLVTHRQSIFLESGTTVRECTLALAKKIKSGDLKDVVIFTNSLTNLEILQSVCSVTLLGGRYRPERQDFVGYLSERTIRGLRFDHSFIGADAINLTDGIMALDIETVRFDELLISRSEKTTILASSSKFQKHSLLSYASLNDITNIITDTNLPDEQVKEFQALAPNLICV